MMNIGLFGGSFDPVHNGHVELALKVLKECELDEVWFVLAYDQPLKDKHFESFENRLLILEKTLEDYPSLKVCTLEETLSKPSYSYNTVIALKEEYPNNKYSWIIGADNLKTLDKWYRIEDLKKELDFIIVNRDQSDLNTDYKTVDFNNPASSTNIRKGNLKYLNDDIIELMFKEKIYIDTILYNVLSQKRADHVLRCVDVALEIADHYDINKLDVYKAVVLHDIAKELDEDVEMGIMKKFYPNNLHYHKKVYHQFTGEFIAKENFRITDDKILTAIRCHTTGDSDDLLAVITYVADKVERGRKYDTEPYIELAKKDIKEAFIVLQELGNKRREEKR